MQRIWEFLSKLAISLVAGAVLRYLVPIIGTIIAIGVGWLEQVSWFPLYLSAVVTFAATSAGLFYMSEWRYRNTAKEKLNLNSILISKGVMPKEAGEFLLGFHLNNTARFRFNMRFLSCGHN